jgi:glycosyltransferase involved in cell wall biosynthesis
MPGAMRVLQVIPTLAVGGAERVVALLARHLRRSGHAVGVVSLYDPHGSWIEAELRSDGVPLYFLGKRPGLDLRMIPRLARVVARFRPDVLHTHLYVLKYVLPALAASRRCRVVHTLHNLAEHEVERLSRGIQSVAFRVGVVPVAIGEAVAESMLRLYRLPPRHRIPNGIPVSDYAPPPCAREEVRASLAIPDDAPTFVSVGRLDPQKNSRSLIEAFASRRLRLLGAHLLFAGDGQLRRELEDQASGLGIDDRVHFLGVRADIPRVLAAADVFVLPSRYEGNPLTVMEAMAAGKPVLATAVGCVPELVSEGAGLLVAPGDGTALESAMLELATDLPRARARGAAAARIARARFDASVMASAYEKLYAEVR